MMNSQEIMNSGQNKDETEGVKSVSSSEDVANCKETQIADTEDENTKKSDVNDVDEEKIDKGDSDQLSGAIFTPKKNDGATDTRSNEETSATEPACDSVITKSTSSKTADPTHFKGKAKAEDLSHIVYAKTCKNWTLDHHNEAMENDSSIVWFRRAYVNLEQGLKDITFDNNQVLRPYLHRICVGNTVVFHDKAAPELQGMTFICFGFCTIYWKTPRIILQHAELSGFFTHSLNDVAKWDVDKDTAAAAKLELDSCLKPQRFPAWFKKLKKRMSESSYRKLLQKHDSPFQEPNGAGSKPQSGKGKLLPRGMVLRGKADAAAEDTQNAGTTPLHADTFAVLSLSKQLEKSSSENLMLAARIKELEADVQLLSGSVGFWEGKAKKKIQDKAALEEKAVKSKLKDLVGVVGKLIKCIANLEGKVENLSSEIVDLKKNVRKEPQDGGSTLPPHPMQLQRQQQFQHQLDKQEGLKLSEQELQLQQQFEQQQEIVKQQQKNLQKQQQLWQQLLLLQQQQLLMTPQQQHTKAFSFLSNQSMPRALGTPAPANKRKYAGSSSSLELNQQVQHLLGMPMPQHITPYPNSISYQIDESSEDEDNVQQFLNPTEFMQQMLQFQAMKNLNEGKRKSKKRKSRSMNFFR